jgi:hypothetical protein
LEIGVHLTKQKDLPKQLHQNLSALEIRKPSTEQSGNREVVGSNVYGDTGYAESGFFVVFLRSSEKISGYYPG